MEEELFLAHLKDGPFQRGIDEEFWGIYQINWPVAIIWIKAKEIDGRPDRYHFRFELSGYPVQAPTACPWDIATNASLTPSLWPKGDGIVKQVFAPHWNSGALYAPCDRIAIQGHDNWKTVHKSLYWRSDFTIVKYLEFIYRILNSDHYTG